MPTWLSDIKLFRAPKNPINSQWDVCWPATQNEVCTVNFRCKIGLVDLAREVAGSLRQDRLTAMTLRIYDSYSKWPTLQCFKSGRGVLVGSPSRDRAVLAVHRYMVMFRNMGLNARNTPILLRNKVSSGYYPHGLNTKGFEVHDSIGTVKDDGSFPGIMFFAKPANATRELRFSFFPTGKFIVMNMIGDEARRAFLHVLPVMYRNRAPAPISRSKAQRTLNAVQREIKKRTRDTVSASKESVTSMVRRTLETIDFNPSMNDDENFESAPKLMRTR
jgi:TATA-box binding protein (TBP) (component of TFIID and TFIIIB)